MDCQYVHLCPHTPQGAQVCTTRGCSVLDYSSEVVCDILISSIFNQDVKREVLGDSAVSSKTFNQIVKFIKNKEAARDAAGGGRSAAAAAASAYKKGSSIRGQGQSQGQQPLTTPSGQKPKKLRCHCIAEFFDFTLCPNRSVNTTAYENCRECGLKQGHPSKRGFRKTAAAAAGGQCFDPPSPSDSPPAPRISSASVAYTNTRLWGQAAQADIHLRLEVKVRMLLSARVDG